MKRRAALALACAAVALAAACGAPARGPVTVSVATVSPGSPVPTGTTTTAPAPAPAPATTATATASDPASPATTATASAELQAAATALGDQGRGDFADTWAALSVDGVNGRVLLYATSGDRARELIAAARSAHPETAAVEVRVALCPYTAAQELAAVDRIVEAQRTGQLLLEIYGVGPSGDGSGVVVHASAEAALARDFGRQLQSVAGTVPVRLVEGLRAIPA
ncbi:hypothetical protein [Kitasatospora sp. NPDC088346]|uniref:hypothetical protein n=1 Tax=Kitasatospora sp. NPDC088346 TaxID=3364073 RepID=UPI00382DE003